MIKTCFMNKFSERDDFFLFGDRFYPEIFNWKITYVTSSNIEAESATTINISGLWDDPSRVLTQ